MILIYHTCVMNICMYIYTHVNKNVSCEMYPNLFYMQFHIKAFLLVSFVSVQSTNLTARLNMLCVYNVALF